jgi:hypothetical protein
MARIKKIYPSDGTATLVFGIALTLIGGGLLIDNFTDYSVWDFIWKLWPGLLIAMGVKILVSHYRRQDRGGPA